MAALWAGAISYAIQVLRPSVEVKTSGIDILTEELTRFAPQAVVVCSLPEGPESAEGVAWIELPPNPIGRPAPAWANVSSRRIFLLSES
jgi:hypothetical protein